MPQPSSQTPATPAGHAAATPAAASPTPIHTDAEGLLDGFVAVRTGGIDMPAYRAMPLGRDRLPVVVVIPEIFGVHAYIADVVRRLARQGWLAIAPELFVRHGDAGAIADIPTLIAEIVSKADDVQVMADLDATVAWAAGHGGDTARLGVTGFCWGGRAVWMYAAHNPGVKAGVAWYGPVARAYAPGDDTAIDAARRIRAPMLGLYGGADAGIPVDTVERMRQALREAGNAGSEIVVYPDTPHAFHADYRPNYRQPQADDGWQRCLAWFRRHGVA